MKGGKKKSAGKGKGKKKKPEPAKPERRKSVQQVGSQKVVMEKKDAEEEEEGVDYKSFESLMTLDEIQGNEDILLGRYCLSQTLVKTPVEWLQRKFFKIFQICNREKVLKGS